MRFYLILAAALMMAFVTAAESQTKAQPKAQGQGIFLLGPGMPSAFTFDAQSSSCSAAIGTLGAPGPGPFNEPAMKLQNVNFGMVVYSLKHTRFEVKDKTVRIEGTARSITTVNDKMIENAVYRFEAVAVDNSADGSKDTWVMTLYGKGLMFDKHPFGTDKGLVSGNIVTSK